VRVDLTPAPSPEGEGNKVKEGEVKNG